ncbi:cytochrome c biogenesis protein CcsA [Adlercreutzia sp. R21]|uniref:heme lyase CcmF/NrfE family subunit n=1 Tax=Adlercreutzia wanghongyangiae TaxID=3111451 RepID=UPI002DBDC54A|nr:cytochrome c biogenesis protein CcsA [Adlercreutzia sp. R21]MEC4183872.1 cytochrome c biogenesis protein CcsA [Adlercreutzia sp. R21]
MSMIGLLGLLVAFAGCAISILCLGVAHLLHKRRSFERAETLAWGGRVATVLGAVALTVCCAVLVWCFFTGDNTIQYVLDNRSTSTAPEAWLYKLAGLWAGRQGSLLFWAWLIAVFNTVLVFATRKNARPLDNGALCISQLVLTAFVAVLLFSEDNMPFIVTDPRYFADGQLSAAASVRSMNALLEHWAMAIHPPTLFIGYAGLTIPFAYAVAALIVNDDSPLWVNRSTGYLMFSWLLLGIGIGLGAVWAYVVLGWGGYWGWDPVENASLLPWLVGVALIHSFTVYRQRGAFKRWSVFCACLTFCFVVLGTFITRSGLVQSVHAFEGDPVSLVMFGALIVLSLLAGVVGLLVRRKSFGAVDAADDDIESMVSKEAAYYVNNLIMVVFAVLLAYMTVSSALPSWLPFGGQSLSAGTYNAIARPLGIAYLAVLAVCPLLGWRRTDKQAFLRAARVPALCALVLFIVLMVYFATYLLPSYDAMIAMGGATAEGLLEQGAPAYYNGITVVGFAVASLLIFNALFMAVRSLKHATGATLRRRLSLFGGSVAHGAMGIILVGLIGSSMYVTEITGYLPYDEETGGTTESFTIQDFELVYKDNAIDELGNGNVRYSLTFDVYRDGQFVGEVNPAVQLVATTQQQKLEASVIGFPLEDLFVVYRGVNDEGDFSMDVRVNPLISLVWVGFGLLMVGCLIPLFAKRATKREDADPADAPVRALAADEQPEAASQRSGVVEAVVAEEVALVEDAEGDAAANAADTKAGE